MEEARFPALDGLRGIAVVGVVICHLAPWSLPDGQWWLLPLVGVAKIGWTGVDLFFVLSGFLITGVLLQHKNASNYFSAFYAHRALRILPLYYLLLLVVTVLFPMFLPTVWATVGTGGSIWPYWLFLSNLRLVLDMGWMFSIAPSWSLSIEEQFYLLWPLAVRRLDRRGLAILACGVMGAGIILRLVLLGAPTTAEPTKLSAVFYFTLTHLDGLCVGILARLLYDADGWRPICTMFARSWWAWVIAFLAMVVIDERVGFPELAGSVTYQPIMLRIGFTIQSLMYATIMLHGLMFNGWVRRVCETSVTRRLGAYSYCIYLIHAPIGSVTKWGISSMIDDIGIIPVLSISCALTVALAHLSYVWLEKPILSLKRFIPYRDRLIDPDTQIQAPIASAHSSS